MPRPRLRPMIALVLVVALTAGCGAWTYTQSMFVTAVSLEAVGEHFLLVTQQVQGGCNDRSIPLPTCVKYKAFHDNFVRAYPLAVGMWRAADKAGDAATKGKAEDVVRGLSRDLATLAAEALSALATEVR